LKFFCVLVLVFLVFFSKRGYTRGLNPNTSQDQRPKAKETKMNRMNRREFFTALAGGTAIAMALPHASASTTADAVAKVITSLHVKGLVMVDLGSPDVVRLGFPKAPGHKATLSIVPQNGAKQSWPLKGRGVIDAQAIAEADSKILVPELIRMKEFYGDDVKSRVDECPGVISIPRNAIRNVTATEFTAARYTFVRADTGKEVTSFRPRQLADAIKIELSSPRTLKLDNGKVIPLETARELRVEYTPEKTASADPFADHFQHYFPYIERPAALDFDVVPRKVSAVGATSAPAARHAGHKFMMLDNVAVCSLVAVP